MEEKFALQEGQNAQNVFLKKSAIILKNKTAKIKLFFQAQYIQHLNLIPLH